VPESAWGADSWRRKKSRLSISGAYLAKARGGITKEYRKKQVIFSQGSPADAVFYIETGKVKLAVLSTRGKEAVVAILGSGDFLVKEASRASRFAWPRRPR
jgi:CRP/FNR family cyclic AMP-dependent transcriptional regulator